MFLRTEFRPDLRGSLSAQQSAFRVLGSQSTVICDCRMGEWTGILHSPTFKLLQHTCHMPSAVNKTHPLSALIVPTGETEIVNEAETNTVNCWKCCWIVSVCLAHIRRLHFCWESMLAFKTWNTVLLCSFLCQFWRIFGKDGRGNYSLYF